MFLYRSPACDPWRGPAGLHQGSRVQTQVFPKAAGEVSKVDGEGRLTTGDTASYCNCIVTRGGVYDEILPETEGNPDSSHNTVILNYLTMEY